MQDNFLWIENMFTEKQLPASMLPFWQQVYCCGGSYSVTLLKLSPLGLIIEGAYAAEISRSFWTQIKCLFCCRYQCNCVGRSGLEPSSGPGI